MAGYPKNFKVFRIFFRGAELIFGQYQLKISSKKSGLVALLFRKKGHKTSIFPVLQNLTHMKIS